MAQGEGAITVYRGGELGYGDAEDVGRQTYAWALNMDCRSGKAVPAIVPTSVDETLYPPFQGVFEWVDSSDDPFFLFTQGKDGSNIAQRRTFKFENGVLTQEDNVAGDIYTGGVLFRHDGTSADNEMAFFCNGFSGNTIRTRTKAGVYGTGSAGAKADQLYAIGADLWRVRGGYKLQKLTLNTDPGDESNWAANSIEVGLPTYPINVVVELGGSPVVLKGDGVFKYNPSTTQARFENMTPYVAKHKNNGVGGAVDGRGRIYYPTVRGGLIVLSFGSQSQQRPTKRMHVGRDTPFGRITAIAADEDHVYAATAGGSIRSQASALGIKVFKELNGTFTDYTDNTTDQDTSTTGNFSDVDENGPDYIWVGADEPFWGVYAKTVGDKTVQRILSGAYSAGSSSFVSVTIKDSSAGLQREGLIAILPSTDIFADKLWVKDTINGESKYWLRISADGLLSGNAVQEIYLCPYRPAIDPNLFTITGQMLAGVLPRILVGTWFGETIIWHDVWTLESEQVDAMLVSRTSGAQDFSFATSTLYCLTRGGVRFVPIGVEADPLRMAWPRTNGSAHAMGFFGVDFGLPVNVKTVQTLVFYGEYLQSDDAITVAYHWDNDDRWHLSDNHSQFPIVLKDLEGRGRYLHVAYLLSDGSHDAIAPYVSRVEIPDGEWFDEGPLHEALGSDIGSPQKI